MAPMIDMVFLLLVFFMCASSLAQSEKPEALLRPGGLMKIGLYSETARQDIICGRALIAEKGYTTSAEDIRRCRQDIIAMVEDGDRKMEKICNGKDFFSLS